MILQVVANAELRRVLNEMGVRIPTFFLLKSTLGNLTGFTIKKKSIAISGVCLSHTGYLLLENSIYGLSVPNKLEGACFSPYSFFSLMKFK